MSTAHWYVYLDWAVAGNQQLENSDGKLMMLTTDIALIEVAAVRVVGVLLRVVADDADH